MSIGHSSSAYSLPEVYPIGNESCSRQDDQLPAPEGERCQLVAEDAHVTGALHDVVGGGEQAATAERKNHRISVQGRSRP